MADLKISELTNLTAADPISDMLPIVDVSATPPASGSTKRISINNLLSSSPTASGALTVTGLVTAGSATITGAATVGTTLGVTGVSTFAAGTALLPALTTTGDTNTGIYYPAADTFAVTTAGVERYRVNSAGQLGIGVTPSAWSAFKAIELASVGNSMWSAGSNDLRLATNFVYNSGDKYVANGRAATYIQTAGTHQWYYDSGTQIANANCAFIQAMTLDASGRLLLGKAASSLGTVGIESAAGGFIQSTVTSDASLFCNRLSSDGETIKFYRQTLQVGNISVTTTATAYNTSSDYRLKEDAQPLVGGLARVNALKPSIYKWKVNGSTGEGFMAHELADVVPFAVTGEKDAVDADNKPTYQGVDLSKIVPILVAAIQELTARVQTLEAK